LISITTMNNLILQIDTSTAVCSVALSENGQTLQVIDLDEPNAHAAKLTILIEEILKQTGRKMQDLNAVAVSMGPGSYTGLRIGVSTAKGLCYALDVPLIAINTLEALFLGYKGQFGLTEDEAYLPMLDARRMEVYTAVYNHNAILERADKFQDLFSATDRVDVLSGFNVSAAFLSLLAFDKFQRKEFEDVAYFEPFYLKDFVVTPAKKKVGLL